MTTIGKSRGFKKSLIAIALLAAFGPACAEDEVAELINPSSSVSVGAAIANGSSSDRTMFGQYNGLRKHDASVLIDIDMVKRDNAAGLWTILSGRNLGLDNQELNFSQQKQGDWKYSLGYDEITKHDIRTINTGLTGTGTATPTVNVLATTGSGSGLDLSLKRKGLSLSGEKWITENLLLDVSFKNEDKDGARLFGKGFTCTSGTAPGCAAGWAILMLPEPVNSTTKQFEAKLNWSGEKFLVTGGYYGSFYNNGFSSLTPTINGTLTNVGGGTPSANAALLSILNLPMALPPDNQAHQFYLSGNYAFTPKTRATFKYAYTHATQDDSFGIFTSAAPAGRTNLGGRVDTTLLQVGLTSRPLPKLALAANLKYEDKNDKTPIAYYNLEGVTTFTNSQLSNRKLHGKLEASYQFQPSTRGTLGVDYNSTNRDMPVSTTQVAGLNVLRAKVEDIGYRAEIRQTFSDNLSGAFSYNTSKMSGSDWFSLATATYGQTLPTSALAATTVYPWMVADREREKFRFLMDWSPTDNFSLQFAAEDGTDHSTMPTVRGNRGTNMSLYSLDANWVVSEKLKLYGFASYGRQAVLVQHSTGYIMDLANTNDSYGLGISYQATGKLAIGADFSYFNDKDRYGQACAGSGCQTLLNNTGGLPDVTFRLSMLKLYGKYALDKQSDILVDLINQNAKLSEWTWSYNNVPFYFSDRTTVTMKPDQKVTFLGARYIYKFQ